MTTPPEFPLTHIKLEKGIHASEYVIASIRNNPQSLVTVSVYTTGHSSSDRPKTKARGYLGQCSAVNIYKAANLLLSHHPYVECKHYRVAVMFADPDYPFRATVLWAPVRFVLDSRETTLIGNEGGNILKVVSELCPDTTIHWNDPDPEGVRPERDDEEMRILNRSLGAWTVRRNIPSPKYHFRGGEIEINA